MPGAGAEHRVEAPGQSVQALPGPGEEALGRVVPAARGQPDLAGRQQLAAAEDSPVHPRALGQPLGEPALVAAPPHVQGPDLARTEPEPGHTDRQEMRRVRSGLAPAHLADMAGERQPATLRRAFAAPLPGEVQDLLGPVRQREQHGGGGEVVRDEAGDVGIGIGIGIGRTRHAGAHPQHAGRVQPVGEGDVEGGVRVMEGDDQFAGALLGAGHRDPGRGGRPGPVTLVGGGAQPAVGLGGPDGELLWFVGCAAEHGGVRRQPEGSETVAGQLTEVFTPVQDTGQRSAEFDDETHPGRAQVRDPGGDAGHGVSSRNQEVGAWLRVGAPVPPVPCRGPESHRSYPDGRFTNCTTTHSS